MSNLQGMIDEDEYPIIFYEPNSDLDLKVNKNVHVFSQFQDAVDYAKSQEMSFLLILPNDFNEEKTFLESFPNKNFYRRRLTNFEEEGIVADILNKITTTSYRVYVLFPHGDFEAKEEAINWELKEIAKKFREEFAFWERKQRGLEKSDTVFEYLEEPQGFADFYTQEDYVKSKEFCIKRLKEIVMKRKQEKMKLIYYTNLGKCCYKLTEYKKALEYFTTAINILTQIYGETHASVAYLLGALAGVYQDLCEYQTALESHTRALDIRKLVYGEDHPETARSCGDLASVYECLDKFQKALEYRTRALDIFRSRYGEIHFETADSYENLGIIYRGMGKYQEAIEHHSKAIDILKSIYGESHPLLANSYDNVAISYGDMEDLEQKLNP